MINFHNKVVDKHAGESCRRPSGSSGPASG